MTVQASNRSLRGSNRTAGFSLAEMMIALIILGFGLMVVGAALPVGLSYTQKNVNRATGDAAAEYALDLIEQNIRTSHDPWDGYLRHTTDIFQPRDLEPSGAFLPLYEPLIKVRPLLPVSIDTTPGATFGEESPTPHDQVEERMIRWLGEAFPGLPESERTEYDSADPLSAWVQPALPSVASVYPPVSSDSPFCVYSFLGSQYQWEEVSDAERLKAIERRTTWTAFYRRVSYAQDSDPNLYEVIVVVTRLSSDAHRFPRFNPSLSVAPTGDSGDGGGGPIGEAVGYGAGDTLAPVPWLVVFKALHYPLPAYDDNQGAGRPIDPAYPEPATLQFLADGETGALLPPGSVFIPAVNDRSPNATLETQVAGFVPHAPDMLPIYEVERSEILGNGDVGLIVKNNGFYPWTPECDTGQPANPLRWPVWVIPPAFKELDAAGNPVYEDSSPIVAVARRIIRFRELP